MGLVAAKCTQCGANIEVDSTKEAGICPACGTAFITEKAVQNYQITNNINVESATFNVVGADINNLLIRAQQFEEKGEVYKAIEYYNKILDIDANNKIALTKINDFETTSDIVMEIQDYFRFGNGEFVVVGILKTNISIGNIVSLNGQQLIIDGIEQFRKLVPYATIDSTVGIRFKTNIKIPLKSGDKIYTTKQKPTVVVNEQLKQSTTNNGCYVATCVYGSYDCPQVWTLRRYRDYKLASSWYGRAFIRTYYAISPTLVKWFGKTKWFKKMWKGKLDKMVKELENQGFENTPYQDKEWRK